MQEKFKLQYSIINTVIWSLNKKKYWFVIIKYVAAATPWESFNGLTAC